ncbi:hypothetical protein NM688_g742 [Phlebia brevispora]|uniref:Uncharacterized protein n=1 Tax=Phlebia brevispora TaxID=194682 RepID=A0ACC1TDG5_9APHY|nr:hypothetical protein NM688_g742 [Phlebia brevispora]
MSSLPPAAIVAAYRTDLTLNYCDIAALDLALTAYEYMITLQHEYAFLWRRKWTIATWLFLVNRYMLLAVILAQVVPYSAQVGLTRLQGAFQLIQAISSAAQLLQCFCDVLSEHPGEHAVFSALRVFALLHRDYFTAVCVLLLGLVEPGAVLYIDSYSRYSYVNNPILVSATCSTSSLAYFLVELAATVLLASISTTIASEVLVVVVTWLKTYRHVRQAASVNMGVSFSGALIQFGTIYFVALLAVNVFFLVTIVTPSMNVLSGGTALFMTILPGLVISRFLINLRQADVQGSSTTSHISDFSAPNFRIPTLPEIIGNLGEPLSSYLGEPLATGDEALDGGERDADARFCEESSNQWQHRSNSFEKTLGAVHTDNSSGEISEPRHQPRNVACRAGAAPAMSTHIVIKGGMSLRRIAISRLSSKSALSSKRSLVRCLWERRLVRDSIETFCRPWNIAQTFLWLYENSFPQVYDVPHAVNAPSSWSPPALPVLMPTVLLLKSLANTDASSQSFPIWIGRNNSLFSDRLDYLAAYTLLRNGRFSICAPRPLWTRVRDVVKLLATFDRPDELHLGAFMDLQPRHDGFQLSMARAMRIQSPRWTVMFEVEAMDAEAAATSEKIATLSESVPTMNADEHPHHSQAAYRGARAMSTSSNSAIVTAYRTELTDNRCIYAALALAAYEHIITFKYEHEFLWRRKWTAATWLFIANRYALLISIVIQSIPYNAQVSRSELMEESDQLTFHSDMLQFFVATFLDLPSSQSVCHLCLYVSLTIVHCIRVFALLDRAYLIAGCVFLLGLTQVGIVWLRTFAIGVILVSIVPSDSTVTSSHSSIYIRSLGIAGVLTPIVADIIALFTTLLKTYQHVRRAASVGVAAGFGAVLIEYGTLFFAVLSVVNVLAFVVSLIVGSRPSSSISHFSHFSAPNFRVPTLPEIIGNLGEPLVSSDETLDDGEQGVDVGFCEECSSERQPNGSDFERTSSATRTANGSGEVDEVLRNIV